MWLHINPRSSDPIYLQIVLGVKSSVAKGLLVPGEKLPSVRELATDLAVNHNTVAKAYQELERDKVIEVIVGRGTFVALQTNPSNREERIRDMRKAIETWLIEAHHLGMTVNDFRIFVNDVITNWQTQGGVSE